MSSSPHNVVPVPPAPPILPTTVLRAQPLRAEPTPAGPTLGDIMARLPAAAHCDH